MTQGAAIELSLEQRQEVASWIETNSSSLPTAVRCFLSFHLAYLATSGNLRKPFDSTWRELRRALGITPSSERRPSGSPLSDLPPKNRSLAKSEREKLEDRIDRSTRLRDWHQDLNGRHQNKLDRFHKRLIDMPIETTEGDTMSQEVKEDTPVEEIELTEEQMAQAKGAGAAFVDRLLLGDAADPSMRSVNETLMPGGAVLAYEEHVELPAVVPATLSSARVVKTMIEQRVRYDFSVAVTRIELDVEKKVVVDEAGDRHVITASTKDFGPARYSVTWDALVTLAVLVGQFAMPLNRLGTMLSTAGKSFTSASLSRMLHYVAERLLPIYLALAKELTDSEILAGDDTPCRVLEVSTYFEKSKADDSSGQKPEPPWAAYRSPSAAEESMRRCEEAQQARVRRRDEGDRKATRTPEETPSLGVLIARELGFESARRDGKGPKSSMNTTVLSGRSVPEDPKSLIVFYRSHLGGYGNLLESVLKSRNAEHRKLILQGDSSSANHVNSTDLHARFDIQTIGCCAHARRPFANYEHEDPVYCEYMLHLFRGLAIHEDCLDEHERNRQNVLAVRGSDSRDLWTQILGLAKDMTSRWSPATKLGTAARYIIKHYDELTAYLDDPRLEATNNQRERMLRTEKLIENSSMFRQSLEGRFVLDVVRTILQTAVAAGVPVHEYLVSVLRASDDDVARHPGRYTPRAWAAANFDTDAASQPTI